MLQNEKLAMLPARSLLEIKYEEYSTSLLKDQGGRLSLTELFKYFAYPQRYQQVYSWIQHAIDNKPHKTYYTNQQGHFIWGVGSNLAVIKQSK
jgi:hypothetical protein